MPNQEPFIGARVKLKKADTQREKRWSANALGTIQRITKSDEADIFYVKFDGKPNQEAIGFGRQKFTLLIDQSHNVGAADEAITAGAVVPTVGGAASSAVAVASPPSHIHQEGQPDDMESYINDMDAIEVPA